MSKELVSSIKIDAPASLVWEILVDFDAFPTWNPFITSADGTVQAGGRLTLRMQPVSGSSVTLRPTVVEVVEGRRLRWQGRLRVRGLFDADHLFLVEPRGAGGVAASAARAVQRSARTVLPAGPGPRHTAGIPRDERRLEGPGGEGDSCA